MKPEVLYMKLAKAIEEAPSIPGCQTSDPEMFFPEPGYAYTTNRELKWALEMCKACPVIRECGEYAVAANEVHGIWGGMTPNERRRLRGWDRGRPKLEDALLKDN